MKNCIYIFFLFLEVNAFGQNNVGIGTNSPAPDAALEVKSSTQEY